MILSGVPRSGKTTFWKRLAIKDFVPSKTSTSTGAAESHFLSAHMSTEMLLDLHLYSETDTEDLTTEALTIYKRILEAAPTQTDSSQSESVKKSTSAPSKSVSEENDQSQTINTQISEEYDSSQHEPQSTDPDNNQQSEGSTASQISTKVNKNEQRVPVKFAYREIINEEILAAQKQEIEHISKEIDEYFNELTSLLQKGEKVPTNIPLIKKICHLIDTGGQRAFLELLPTVTVGKALYLLFFSYEHFDSRNRETVQQQGASTEVLTGTFYEQMDIVMQSLICVSSTSSVSKDNIALLVGTHVDKVEAQHVENVNKIVSKKVEPFLKSGLVFADEEKDKMVLEVSTEETKRCSNRPEDYRKVILDIAENKLSCPESEKLPASWYMFSIVLRRMKIASHSVLRYSHCQQIASKLYIKEKHLQSLLSRLHKILGIVMYFPEVRELEDLVICDPSIVYRGISELIFNSFTKRSTMQSLQLRNWGTFTYRELMEHCRSKTMNKGYHLLIDQLIIILQHLGIITPVQLSEPDDSSAEPKDEKHSLQSIDAEFIILAVLNNAGPEELQLQLQDGEACSIIPLRLYFKCGFSPMGGFCYLFARLISDRKWKLPLKKEQMMIENKIYWRNKATFVVEADQKKYFVTLVSTKVYYEIHIVHTHSKEPFQLKSDGRNICRKVWNDIETVISNSLNAPLKEYTVACQCTLHGRETEHAMEFDSKPHDEESEIKANCLLDKNRPHPLTVDTSEQSIIVWFKEPHDHQVKNLGSVVELSMDHLFMTTASSGQLKYQWSRIINDEEEKIEDEECFKNSDSKTMILDSFESNYGGTYRCVISTSIEPVVSISAEVELNLPDFPEEFSTEMSNKEFLLFLNANGIRYKVCKKLKEQKITAKKFNLSSFASWAPHLNLTSMEMSELQDLLTQISPASEVQEVQAEMKCPVCRTLQVDPCTLQCGHTICQLCLARMYKNFDKFCPMCKEPWSMFPAISYDYRANIESSYSDQVSHLRMQYTQEDIEVIEEFLKAKRSFSLKSETHVGREGLFGDPLLTFSKHLDHEHLSRWLSHHPRFMAVDYQQDIGKLKDAKISGDVFLSLDKGSLEHYGLSTEFQTPLMKIIEEVKTYPQFPETETELQLYQQKSLKGVLTAATDSSGTGVQSTETSKSQIGKIDAAQSIESAQATDLAVWTLPGVEECSETSVVVHSSQGQLVEWNGLKLHIHAGSLPEGLQQCTIFIKASLAGDYEIPENTSLVSGVFWLRCKPQCTFIKPIIVEIQHCSTKRDLSKLKIVRAFCNQKSLPYKFKPLGGSFNADTFYGAIDMKGFSGVGVVDENPDSERMYYNQLFYRSHLSDQQRHEIHIIFVWNTELHLNHISRQYPEDSFLAGCHRVIEIEGKVIEVVLDAVKWTKVMDGQWELQPAQPKVTKAELDDFKPGRGLPSCVLEARPLCEDYPQLLHQVILNGVKPPHHEVILSYMPSRMNRDYPGGASVQQPQSPPTIQTRVDVHSQSSTFSKYMSNEQLALWLRNHPSLSGTNYEEDIGKLRDARINGHVFLSLNKSRLEYFSVSVGFQFAIVNIIEDMLQKSSHQPPSSERLRLQQQSPRGSVATPRTTQHQLSSSTARQQTKLDYPSGASVQQPQSPPTVQMPVDVHLQSFTFSEDMSSEQLALWLRNHPSLSEAEYEEDISKFRDAKVNGRAFLSLNESRLERSGVSFGFQCTLMDVIEKLKSSDQGRDSEGLPPQPESLSSSSQLSTSESATGQQNQTKLDELPTLDELLILKYTDEGKQYKLRIIKEASHKWKDIANLISGDVNITITLEDKCRGDPNECLKRTFIDYFINKKPQRHTQNWNGLIELLDDVDLETLAEKVKHALLFV